jgi:hypothetical protein
MVGSAARPPGMLVGLLVCVAFGVVFVEVNSGGLTDPWPLVVRVAGAVVALVLLAGVAVLAREPVAPLAEDHRGFVDRRYWAIVAGEGVALFAGLVVINAVLGANSVAVAWIAVVVGVHFVLLARVWHIPSFTVLGVGQTVLGVAGFVLGAAGASAGTIGLVSGVCSGVALFAMAAYSIGQVLRGSRVRG